MPNSEKDKKSNVLRELKVRLYVEKDEDIANYLRKQKTTTLNSFIRFLIRDALEKYGDQDYFEALKKFGDAERKQAGSPKVSQPTDRINNQEISAEATVPPSPTASEPKTKEQSQEKKTNNSKKVQKDSTPKKREIPEEKKGSPRKHKKLPQDPYDIFKDGNTFD